MRQEVEVVCGNTKEKKNIVPGLNLAEIAVEFNVKLNSPILGAMVNNTLKELSYEVYSPKTIHFIDISHTAGMRMYQRSLFFVLQKAVKDLIPGSSVRFEHSVSKGFYCEIDGCDQSLELPLIFNIGDKMREIVEANIPFKRDKVLTTDVVNMFERMGYYDKAKLFRTRPKLYTSIYYLGDSADYFFGSLVPTSGYLKVFDLVKYYQGMLLRIPKRSKPEEVEDIEIQDQMFEIFQEHKDWVDILGVGSVAAINEQVQRGYSSELIKISEALHEKKVAQIADILYCKRDKVRVVLISGPSSSGKTTFAKRLSIQLKVSGLKPYTISLDNYFVDREDTPKDENGDYDFESIKALDVDLFNRDLLKLLNGEEVELPKFSFEKGKRVYDKTFLKIESNGIIVIEGIHALTPELTLLIPAEKKFKVYVSALTSLSFDSINRIPTTDNRLIRRIIRDYKYRGYSALDTIRRWDSVRRGEDKNIFPYQEQADVMFNSSLLYELSVLKSYAEPILYELPSSEPEYSEAVRLQKFLSYFTPIPNDEVPPTSILREFLGGSTFSYK
ncbi:MAG: nucleoside kinase [Bacteroidales bacterium]|nr:MAG: nucleoside kinase [Bacteroidales bacterium]